MDEEASLESYFDQSIAGSSEYIFEGDLGLQGPPQLQDPSFFSSSVPNQQKDLPEDLDLSFLPDELSAQDEGGENRGVGSTEDSGVYLDCTTGSSIEADSDVNRRQPAASPFCSLPMTPMTPMTPVAPVAESSGIIPQLQNIVSTVNLACPLDLKAIALQARNAEYNPKRFAAVIMRIREPRTTALIFSSGKMVCTGAKSEEQSRLAARKYARVVQKLGFPAKFLDFKIQNMVGSCDVCFPIRLEGLVLTHQQFSSYEPELFPGLIYRMVKPRIVLLIFVSGKVVLTGVSCGRSWRPPVDTPEPVVNAELTRRLADLYINKQESASTMACPPESDVRVVGPCESGTEGSRAQARAASRQDQHCPGAVAVSPATVMVESVDDAEGLYVAVERCPLCNTARRRLTCARCVRAGDFVYFDGKNPERYAEKLERLQKMKKEKEILQQRVIKTMDKKVQADQLKWKIMSCKMKIEQLKEAICNGNEEVKSGKDLLLRSQEEGQRLQRRASRHQEKRDKIERHNRRLSELLEKRNKELQSRLETLAEVRRGHILELTSYIFPTQEEKQGSRDPAETAAAEYDFALTSSTVSELAEARRTTYMSGRWIWDDQNGETSISITGPHVTLPSNGDCSAYYNWVEEKSTNPGPELDHITPAHTISAALCYATQLVNILSHILDVNLPKKLCNSEFCGDNLSRYRFTRAVNKLNTNVLHLCFSQHVDSELLHPHHTLRNIMFLVSPENKNLGRTGPFEVSADLEDSMEFLEPEASGAAEESGNEAVTDEETDLGTDWETVPSPRFCDIPSQPMDLSQSTAMQVSQPAGNAGGMISSAAASVTSWFRAYTGQR
ncbi:hypothetical protein QTP86_018223 [Hemibagrus guttatus]|nr:hypothetical protein QTP86_018223 [Hemibagrus guttatus]